MIGILLSSSGNLEEKVVEEGWSSWQSREEYVVEEGRLWREEEVVEEGWYGGKKKWWRKDFPNLAKKRKWLRKVVLLSYLEGRKWLVFSRPSGEEEVVEEGCSVFIWQSREEEVVVIWQSREGKWLRKDVLSSSGKEEVVEEACSPLTWPREEEVACHSCSTP